MTSDIAIQDLSSAQAEEELEALANILAKANDSYHGKDAPEISDAEYDRLKKRNSDIEARFPSLKRHDSPSDKIGSAPADGFSKVKHEVAMLSLSNAFNDEDIVDFDIRIRKYLGLATTDDLTYTAEPKIDGLSLSLRYERGNLVHAATRGDGSIGENLTENALTIASIPARLTDAPEILEVRGEVYMGHDDFEALNARQLEQGGKVFANPRNYHYLRYYYHYHYSGPINTFNRII